MVTDEGIAEYPQLQKDDILAAPGYRAEARRPIARRHPSSY